MMECWVSCWAVAAATWLVVWTLILSLVVEMWDLRLCSTWCRVVVSCCRVESAALSFLKAVMASAMTSRVGRKSWARAVAVG